MRKYRAEQIMKWIDIKYGWRLHGFLRREGKGLFLDSFLIRQKRMEDNGIRYRRLFGFSR